MRKHIGVAVALLAVAACGDGNGDTKSADVEAAPVLIGMINSEGAGRQTLENFRKGTEAAVRYFNAERGGLQGRPIELRTCTTAGAPERSAACAHEMVEQKVVAVRGGVDLGSGASLPILKAAGIPYLVTAPLLPPDFTTEGAFSFVPGGVGNAATAYYVADTLGAKKVAVLQADDPAGKNLAEAFVKPALRRGGVAPNNITMHSEKTDAADLAGVLQAGVGTNPDAIVVLFPPPACARIMQAAASLKVKVPMVYIEPCGDPAILKAGGDGADGAYFNGAYLNVQANPDDDDVKLYRANIAKYGEGVDGTSVEALQGFATTMTVLNRIATITGDLTPAAITAAFKSAVDEPGFMTHSYTCDGKQSLPAFVSVCNSHVRIYQYKGGKYRDVLDRWVSASEPLRQ